MQTKDYVRTPQGAAHYGQPIGSRIVRDQRSMYTGIFDRVKHAGATVRLTDLGEPTTGFVIAERGKNQEIPEEVFFDRARGKALLHAYVREHAEELSQPDRALGLWHDEENGEVVLDTVFVMGDREQAIFAGQQNNQQAIYDVEAGDVINTGGTGDRNALVPGADRKSSEAGERDDAGRGRRVAGPDPGRDGRGARSLKARHVRTPEGARAFGQAIGSVIVPDGAHVRTGGAHVHKPRPSKFRELLRAREFYGAVTASGKVDDAEVRRRIAAMSPDDLMALIHQIEQMRYSREGEHTFSHRYSNAQDILFVMQGKSRVQRVRTPAGRDKYGQEIGEVIEQDPDLDVMDLFDAMVHLGLMPDTDHVEYPSTVEVRPGIGEHTGKEFVYIPEKRREFMVWKEDLSHEGDPAGLMWVASDPSRPNTYVTLNTFKQGVIDDLLGMSFQTNTTSRPITHTFVEEMKERWVTWNGKMQTSWQVRDYLGGHSHTLSYYTGAGWRDSGVNVEDFINEITSQPETTTFRGMRLNKPTLDAIIESGTFDEPLGTSTGDPNLATDFALGNYGLTDPQKNEEVLLLLHGPSYPLHHPVQGTDYDEHWVSGRYDITDVYKDPQTGVTAIACEWKAALKPNYTKDRFVTYDPSKDFDLTSYEGRTIDIPVGGKKTLEQKSRIIRRVRTQAGVRRYGLPINSVIGFTGTRNGMTQEQRNKVGQILKGVRPKEVHHGDAVGADTDFHKMSRRLKLRIHQHPSNLPDNLQGNNGGAAIRSKRKDPLARNVDIVNRSKAIIATPSSMTEERRSGTWHTIRQARKQKKPLIIVFPDGTMKTENLDLKKPTPVAAPSAPTPVVTPNAPSTATQGGTLTYTKPHKNFPKTFKRVVTPSGEWYHVGNAGTDQKPNWRVYLHDEYNRKGIVSTRNKTELDAIQWIRNKHRNDVVVSKRRRSVTPEEDAKYQHRIKLSKALAREMTRIHELPSSRPDTAEWHVVDGHLIIDSYAGFNDVIKRIERTIPRHVRAQTNPKLTPNQKTSHRHMAREVDETITVIGPRIKPGTGALDSSGNWIPKEYEPEQRTRDQVKYEGALPDLIKKLNDLHNIGPLTHKEPPLNETRAWARAIDLIESDRVLTRNSPLAQWARSGGKLGVSKRVLSNVEGIIRRRQKDGLDTTDAEALRDWMSQRVKPTITKVPTQMVPRTHQWRRPPEPLHKLPGGEATSYHGDEIWISDVTFDDPNGPRGAVVNLKFIKTKHSDGTYSIQYPDGYIENYATQREANFAASQWLKKNTPMVPMDAKSLIDVVVKDILHAVELKTRHVVDADYWGLPVGTPITEHTYRAHPRLHTVHMRVRNTPRQAAASKPDVIEKKPSKYEDYDYYEDSSGRGFYVGEVDDGFWVATDGDNLDLWPASGTTKSEVLRELRAYVGRTQTPPPAAAPAPQKTTQPAKKATHKPLKVTAPRKPAKKAPAKKAPAKRTAKKAPSSRTAASKPAPATQRTIRRPKASTGATKPRAKGIPRGQLSIVDKKNGDITVTRDQDGTVYNVTKTTKGYSVVNPVDGHKHESMTRTGILIAIQRNFAIDRGVMEAGIKKRHIDPAGWKKRFPTGDPLTEGAVSAIWNGQKRQTISGYHYASFEDRIRAMKIGSYGGGGPMSRNCFVIDGFDKMTDAQLEKLDQPVYYYFTGKEWHRGYTEAFHVRQQKKNFATVATIDASGADKKIAAYLEKNWQTDPVAACLRLIWIQHMRPSKDESESSKGMTYGASNLQRRHVFLHEKKGVVILRFIGKDYKQVEIEVKDPGLVKQFNVMCKGPDGVYKPQTTVVEVDPKTGKKRKVKKGKLSDCYAETDALLKQPQLFPDVTPKSMTDMLRQISGDQKYTLKKLRTYGACVMAREFVDTYKPPPKTPEELHALAQQIATEISEALGNTPKVVLDNYIDPNIWGPWLKTGWEAPTW